jgi:hypothetical protein
MKKLMSLISTGRLMDASALVMAQILAGCLLDGSAFMLAQTVLKSH